MDKKQYLYELAKQLKDLEQEEFDEALAYIEEYFEEAGIENEKNVIIELGTPAKYAAQIKAELAAKNTYFYDTQTPPKSSIKKTWLVVLGICALPIAAPLALVVVALIFALFMVVLAFAVAGAACILTAIILFIPLLISSFSLFSQNMYSGMVAFGFDLLLLGFILLAISLYYSICVRAFPACLRFSANLFAHLKNRVKKEQVR